MNENIDYLKCTIDGIPMENFFSGIPIIQNSQEWIDEERRKKERYDFVRSMADAVKANRKVNYLK